jgi:hypothetical protein
MSDTQNTATVDTASTEAAGPRVAKGALQMKQFAGQTWIQSVLFDKPMGTKVYLGTILGFVTRADAKTEIFRGSMKSSTVLKGAFELASHVTGEIFTAPVIYLPESFALQIQAAMDGAAGIKIEFDLDVYAERVEGSTVYQYVIVDQNKRNAPSPLDRLRAERAASRREVTRAIGGTPQLLLPGAVLSSPKPEPEPEAEAKAGAGAKAKGKAGAKAEGEAA